MKTKITQNQRNIFFIGVALGLKELYADEWMLKPSVMLTKIILVLTFFFTISNSFAQNNSCEAEFGVEKDRSTRGVSSEGTYYKMVITNTSKSNDTYFLSSNNINSSCSNADGSTTANNVDLNISFLDANYQIINDVTLNKGETKNFLVFVTIPNNTTINTWSCTEIIAKSKTCPNYILHTSLQTRVTDPNKN